MGSTIRYLAIGTDQQMLVDWFRTRQQPPSEQEMGPVLRLHFSHLGPIVADVHESPLVSLWLPIRKRGVLWTVGEIHFMATRLRSRFPELHRVARDLKAWLAQFTCVHESSGKESEWSYFLEGTIRNRDGPVFGLPAAMTALHEGQYFVAEDDNDFLLEQVCKRLRLRGVQGIEIARE